MPLSELVAEFQAEIGTYCVATYSETMLFENDACPRFVFVPKRHELASPQDFRRHDGYTKALFSRWQVVELHCWGATTDDCELLEAGAITALRKITSVNYKPLDSNWVQPKNDTLGWLLIHTFKWCSAIRETDLKNLPPSTGVATIEDVQFDTSGAVAGDGVMVVGEDEIFEGD